MSRRETPRPPLRRRFLRVIGGVIGTLVLTIGILSLGAANASSAQAFSINPIDKMCENDQHLALPSGADNGSAYTTRSIGTVDGFTIVSPSSGGATWRAPGDGLDFVTFGLSMCHDAGASISTTIGSFLWQFVAVWPARIVGMALDWALSGVVSATLLGLIQAPVERLYSGVYLQWAPLLVGLTLIGILWRTALRKGKPLSEFSWMIASIVMTGILASPAGIALAKSTTTAVGQMATCAAIAPAGGDCSAPGASVSSTVIDGLLTQTWSAATLGDLADDAVPTSITLNEALKDSTPDVRDSYAITIPVDAIPAGADGVVSWAEAWRWTLGYTDAESSQLASEPASRCTFVDRLPTIGDVTGATHGDLVPTQLCSSKALVRSALISELATHHQSGYATATGRGGAALSAGISGIVTLALMVGISVIACLGLVAEVTMVGLCLIAPIAGLGSIRSPLVARKWASKLGATIVKRAGVGIALGISLWMISAISTMMTTLLTGVAGATGLVGLGIATVAPKILPVAVALMSVLAMLGAFKMLSQIEEILLAGLDLPDDGSTNRGRQVAAGVVGAAASAMGAPKMLAKGLGGGLGGGARGGLGSAMGALARGGGGGLGGRGDSGHGARQTGGADAGGASSEVFEGGALPTPPAPPGLDGLRDDGHVGPNKGASQPTRTAWTALRQTTPAVAHRQRHDAAAMQVAMEDADALRTARREALQARASAEERARGYTASFIREGAPEEDADRQARDRVAEELRSLDASVATAQQAADRSAALAATTAAVPTRWDERADQWGASDARAAGAYAAL
ncbi:MAG: hypothetical protein HGA44_06850, partial [Cellulomonadaceae bacterium]|nr:hypothetical protein [Cellulomonadaceae bacterium]